MELARRIREVRASNVAGVRSGILDVKDILESKDPFTGHIKVVVVVESVPSLGKVKARRILDDIGILGSTKIHELDERRRSLLIERISDTTHDMTRNSKSDPDMS